MSSPTIRKRQHHYVWKHYLRAWARGERIFTMLGDKLLDEKLDAAAQERDFYELQMLTREDVDFIRWFVVERAAPHLRELHENALRLYLTAQRAVSAGRGLASQHPEAGREADALASNVTEDWHASLERYAATHLERLRAGDAEFYEDTTSCLEFTVFLATQYFRTKAAKEVAVASLAQVAGRASPARMWDLLAHMFSHNVAWHLFATREKNKLRVVVNETSIGLITSDQPVVNLAASKDGLAPDHMTLYYPIAPDAGVIVGDPLVGYSIPASLLAADVRRLNAHVKRHALLRTFAKRKEELAAPGEA